MDVLNETPFPYGPLVWQKDRDNYMLTVVVKGTFAMCPDGDAVLAQEQIFPTGNEYYPDDEEGTGSCRYESDFSYFKPRADVLLVGRAHTPIGELKQDCGVRLRVGSLEKTLFVFGDRHWQGLSGFAKPSKPVSFSVMDLRYENAYGGLNCPLNPVGKGQDIVVGSAKKIRPLPNIETPGQTIVARDNSPAPAGFGPVNHNWQQRTSKLGTYDDAWLSEHWPGFPKDFDWGYFNAAPVGQQLEGYLKGDEEMCFTNLNSQHAQYVCRLPGLRIRCFVVQAESAGTDKEVFRELDMPLDTLWVDMEGEQLCLVWRGVIPIATDDYQDVHNLLVVSERLGDELRSVDHYENLLAERLAEEAKVFEPEPLPDSRADVVDIDAEIAKVLAEVDKALQEAGVEPRGELPEVSEELKEQEARILAELGIQLEEPVRFSREKVVEKLSAGQSLAGEDLRGLDLSCLSMSGADLSSARLGEADLRRADLSGADLHDADLSEADLSEARLCKANLTGADLTKANLTQTDLREALLEDAILQNAHLQGAFLNKALAHYTNFCEANLVGATLQHSVCTGADFSKADLREADFCYANLSEASLEGANAQAAKLIGANLTELRASEGADFRRAVLQHAVGPEAIWIDAKLDDADFSYTSMPGADFTGASMKRVNLHASEMSGARLIKVDLFQATMTSMNLFQGSLEKSNLTQANIGQSNLYGVEFLGTTISNTLVHEANLKMTKLARD